MPYYIKACLLRSPYFVTFAALYVFLRYGHKYSNIILLLMLQSIYHVETRMRSGEVYYFRGQHNRTIWATKSVLCIDILI